MPTTVFWIVALYFFSRGGDERYRAWLLGHRVFGPVLRDWEEEKSLPVRVKVIATVCIVVSCGISIAVMGPELWIARWATFITGAVGVWYVLSRRTKRPGGLVVEKGGGGESGGSGVTAASESGEIRVWGGGERPIREIVGR